MIWEEHASLAPYNTFGIDAKAERLVHLETEACVADYRIHPKGYAQQTLLISGGSNMLLCADVPGTTARIAWTGQHIVRETDDHVFVQVAAGENWHDTVRYTVEQDWGGLQNLSLIPGLVGAAPVQNIGAYGVELADSFDSLRFFSWETGEIQTLSHAECAFGYRDSIFKGPLKDKGVILSVIFRLTKHSHVLKTSYGAIQDELAARGQEASVRSISDAVIAIRQSKLPDPKVLGNSGSFFKNPALPAEVVAALAKSNPTLPQYPQGDGSVKVAAGWLIEQAGWKGKRIGQVGMHAHQALVLVNYGGATGPELWAHAQRVQDSVKEQFGIHLEPEVNLIG
ncbi:MAG TPA: UDP-N-acetylenolpyruvoylglucosamine reductase [Cryomorphaceae bacterium]|nr:UDP-N-acetylenolpyruvoylglucosamine reductase [Cryomorphaceae bacterium]